MPWREGRVYPQSVNGFFRIGLVHESVEGYYVSLLHDNLQNHYTTNFSLMQHHKYSLEELENMIPWEREVYVQLLVQHLDEEAERAKSRSK